MSYIQSIKIPQLCKQFKKRESGLYGGVMLLCAHASIFFFFLLTQVVLKTLIDNFFTSLVYKFRNCIIFYHPSG